MYEKPKIRPSDPRFSCGPCKKPNGWDIAQLSDALVGRSHRTGVAVDRIRAVCDKTHHLLGLPEDYKVAIVTGSNTGAYEMAMWSLLGARPVSALAWDYFGKDWLMDAAEQLGLQPKAFHADFGSISDLSAVNFDDDVCFCWNGTSSGVCMPSGDGIPDDRKGLTICDATSAVFGLDVDFSKLDVITFSWQKLLGGEAGHGVLILSPRAIERLQTHTPSWPIPKLFRMAENQVVSDGFFEGRTLNTPSMICVEDALVSLEWVERIGGLEAMLARTSANAKALADFVNESDFLEYVVADPAIRSATSVSLRFSNPAVEHNSDFITAFRTLLEEEGVAYDIANYPLAPPGLRIWCGGTVDESDVRALGPWLEWAYRATAEKFGIK